MKIYLKYKSFDETLEQIYSVLISNLSEVAKQTKNNE